MLRKLVALVGLITIAVGVLQILFPRRFEMFACDAFSGVYIYILGGISLLFGIVLTLAVAAKAVRIPRLVLALGIISLFSGLFIIVAPSFARDIADSFYFNRASAYRSVVTFAGGVLRIIFGSLLVYVGVRPPAPRTPRLGSIVPLA